MPLEMTTPPARRFVPQQIDLNDFANIEPLYQQLYDRSIHSVEDLEQWLGDFSELSAAVSEFGSRRNIEYSCHTDDKEIEAAYLHYIENIAPKVKPWFFKLQQKYLASGFTDALAQQQPKFVVLNREWQVDVDLFREENVALQTQSAKVTKEYDQLCGEMLVDFDGKQRTLQQMARYYEETDRTVRQQAWEIVEGRRKQDAQAMDDIFDKLMDIRGQMAKNAGFDNYRDYMFVAKHRFDYSPQDCHDFADAIEEVCMPLVKKLNEKRRVELGLEKLRPWDMSVDPKNRAPLRPFDADQVQQMVTSCREIFNRMSASLATDFDQLKFGRNLDLDSRKGKRPGGYQASLLEVRQPFIFMNAAGLHRDVETMLHEAGHAFHYMWACEEPLVFLQHAPIEFCEVASMTMELLADPHMDVFYDGEDVNRAVQTHLEGIIRFFPWMATIDQFQHWLYTHQGHTQAERREAWLKILNRFTDGNIDWSGYEPYRDTMWMRQLHLYHYPFYYVEYGIAQLGALQMWVQAQQDKDKALANYRAGLKLGNTRPLPQLFEAAGIKFDFSSQTFAPLMQAIGKKMAELSA